MVVREERKRGMDRSDDRDSYTRRRNSGREREPSPKKLRRDRERDEKRLPDFSSADLSGRNSRHRNSAREVDRTRDTKNTEAKRSSDGLKDSSETNKNGGPDENRLHPDPREFARSKIYLQHDDRGSSGQVVQIHVRHDADNTRSNLKEHKSGEKSNDNNEFDMKHATKKKDDSGCGHDGFSKQDSAPPSEKKMPPEPELGLKKLNKEHDSSHSTKSDAKKLDSRDDTFGRRDDRVASRDNVSRSRWDDRLGRRDVGFNRGNGNRHGDWLPRSDQRDRFRGRGSSRGRERFSGTRFGGGNQLHEAIGAQTDRWKHDKYEEANQSPTNEDEQIAKIEELLAL